MKTLPRTRIPGPSKPLLIVVLGGLVLRLVIAPFGQYEPDLDLFGTWALGLADHGPAHFYDRFPAADHLPGDLWLLYLVGSAFHLLEPDGAVGAAGLVYLLKLVPIAADTAIVGMLYLIGRQLGGQRAGLVAGSLYAFNPAPIFISAVWGQWDSVSAALAVLAVWLFFRGSLTAAVPALAWAALIKPQLALVGLILIVVSVFSRAQVKGRGIWRRVALGGLLAAAVVVIATVPFGVPPWPADPSFFDRAQFALDLAPYTTVSAFNFWAFWDRPGQFEGLDSEHFAFGVDAQTWGVGLLALVTLIVLMRLARRPDAERVLWASIATNLALFAFFTRMHERYLLPAVAFGAALAAIDRRYRPIVGAISASLLANVWWVYEFQAELAQQGRFVQTGIPLMVAIVNVGLLALLLGFTPSRRRGRRRKSSAARSIHGRRRPAKVAATRGMAPAGRHR